jgi:oligosaccharide 4-alpha-D-glucosyltransferase
MHINSRFLLPLFLLQGIFPNLFAQDTPLKKLGPPATFNGQKLTINTGKGFIEVQPFSGEIIKVTYKVSQQELVKSDLTVLSPDKVQVTYKKTAASIVLQTSELSVIINRRDWSVSFVDKKGDTLSKAFNVIKTGDSSSVDFKSDGKEAFYGGGSKAIYLNKRGKVLQNYNQAHFDYQFGEKDMNIAIPFVVSSRKYGLFVDNVAKSSFDAGAADPKLLRYKTSAGVLNFFFIGGESLDQVLSSYTLLTGRQPLPPRWALGYISSRYGYKSSSEIQNVVAKTQAAGIPLDGVVFDLFWYKADTLMGNYTWNTDSFPDPHKMLHTLLNRGIKTVLISEPYITEKSANFTYAKAHHLLTPDFTNLEQPHIFGDFWAGPAALVDIFKPAAQQYYWGFYKEKIEEGVSGWWFDLLEPERSSDSLRFSVGKEINYHNLFPLVWEKNAFDGYRRDFPADRIFLLPRSGYAGMQRYSTFPWSGDNDRSWEGLKAQIPIILNMGLGGVGYMHSDAGGFTGNKTRNPELYSRWLEFAAFSPVMRTHGDATGYTPEPVFWDDTTRLRVTRYIKLRYQLLPYNYTLAYQNTITGRPLAMPVNYFEAENTRLENINDEFLWGAQMLVAPVIVNGQTVKKVLFPKGEWIGWNDLKYYRDSAEVTAPVDSLPIFVKAGSIIPMVSPITNTSQYDGRSVILKYYAGKDQSKVSSEWFFDDGSDPQTLANGKYDLVTFITQSTGTGYQITIVPKHLINKQKHFRLLMPGKHIKSVSFSSKTNYSLTCGNSGETNGVDFDWNGKPLVLTVKS